MKKMKRLAALALAGLLVLCLAACGSKGDAVSYTAGVVDGSIYTNRYFGFAVTLSEDFGWTYFTDDQIAQVTGQAADALDSEEFNKMLESGQTVTEMYAFRNDSATVNVGVENLGAVNGAKMDESAYADASLEVLPDQLTAAGFTNLVLNKTTLTFAGAEHYGINIIGEVQGVALQETLACVKVGNYVAVVTAVTYTDDTPADILAAFVPCATTYNG